MFVCTPDCDHAMWRSAWIVIWPSNNMCAWDGSTRMPLVVHKLQRDMWMYPGPCCWGLLCIVCYVLYIGTVCCDDGCHLKRFTQKRAELTPTAKKLSSYSIVVGKMHFMGYTDGWWRVRVRVKNTGCTRTGSYRLHKNCHPYKLPQIKM